MSLDKLDHRKVALVTGASSGIGQAIASALVARGYRVLGTTRKPASAPAVDGVEWLALDLTDPTSITACAAAAGPVDVLVNNAGESQVGAFEEVPAEEFERHFQLNVFGAVRLTQAVLPGMRSRGFGRIVMIGSMQASFPMAYRSGYTASKAAIKGFAMGLRREVAPFGIGVSTVEPGSINTGISERRTRFGGDGSPYAADYATVSAKLDANETTGVSPEAVAAVVVKAVVAARPAPLYGVGSNAPVVFALKRLLPRGTVERVIHRKHGL
ncbi:SDR family oxidoreductase [Nocardioides speluncae]|uniref:SDR family oxidoreductase n=1 Tax=Nocardioides speluncae TaxID=2670337 RepID=UPI000D695B4F|nr:SDR family oxidoreductase [Nocardioides speluncae]